MIRKLKSGEYRLYSKKPDAKTGKRRNLGTFDTREAAEKHEREVQYSSVTDKARQSAVNSHHGQGREDRGEADAQSRPRRATSRLARCSGGTVPAQGGGRP